MDCQVHIPRIRHADVTRRSRQGMTATWRSAEVLEPPWCDDQGARVRPLRCPHLHEERAGPCRSHPRQQQRHRLHEPRFATAVRPGRPDGRAGVMSEGAGRPGGRRPRLEGRKFLTSRNPRPSKRRQCPGLITRRSQVRILPPLCNESPAHRGAFVFLSAGQWRDFCPTFGSRRAKNTGAGSATTQDPTFPSHPRARTSWPPPWRPPPGIELGLCGCSAR